MTTPDPFALFQIEPAFDVDLKTLGARHRELSRALHPDRHLGAAPRMRREALSRAIEVNEAWRVLKDPIRRAEALCRTRGIEIEEKNQPQADPMFLMEMMELREQLGDARRDKNLEQVEKLAAQVRAAQAERETALAERFLGLASEAEVSEQVVATLLRDLGSLRYYRRFLDEAEAIEDDLS